MANEKKWQKKKRVCANCVWFYEVEDDMGKEGECRINPPQLSSIPENRDVPNNRSRRSFPYVEGYDWCGSFKRAKEDHDDRECPEDVALIQNVDD